MTRPTIQWMDPATRALDNDHIVPRTDRATVREGIENWVAHHIEGWARGETKNAGCSTRSSSVYGAHVLRTRDGEDVYEVLDLQHVMAESDAADSEARDDVREVDTPSGSPGP
jgi:argininosuccinate lyase